MQNISGGRDVAAVFCPMTSGGMDDVDAGYNPAKWTYTVSYQKAGDGIALKETKSMTQDTISGN